MKLNLVLDLDDTLIHTIMRMQPAYLPKDHFKGTFQIIDDVYGENIYNVYFRPYLEEFIDNVESMYNIYIYSNGVDSYVNNALRLLRNRDKITDVFSRKTPICSIIKDLEKYDLDPLKTVIIDDRLDVWDRKYYDNIIIIPAFYYTQFTFMNSDMCLEYIEKRLCNIHKLCQLNPKINISNIINYSSYL
jgi:TFIIF-interacting CTD phosphatase-like protein